MLPLPLPLLLLKQLLPVLLFTVVVMPLLLCAAADVMDRPLGAANLGLVLCLWASSMLESGWFSL